MPLACYGQEPNIRYERASVRDPRNHSSVPLVVRYDLGVVIALIRRKRPTMRSILYLVITVVVIVLVLRFMGVL